MSSNVLDSVIVPANSVRDLAWTHDATAVNIVHDVPNEMQALGLDLFIRNRGAAALTIAINGQAPITVDPGGVYRLNDVKFWLVNVQSAVVYDFQIFGIRITTLKRMGLL